ncbi:MAG: hypothetical protein QM736_14725 [Vicinamibacterales bacterium]
MMKSCMVKSGVLLRWLVLLLASTRFGSAVGASAAAGIDPGNATPSVYLTHVYVNLDQISYDALRDSKLLAALGNTEEKHTVSGDTSWSGFYVTGWRTSWNSSARITCRPKPSSATRASA